MIRLGPRSFELFDHLPAAAAIARQRIDADRIVARQHTGIHQRPNKGDGAGRIAAWVGNPRGVPNFLGLIRGKLGEAINPSGIDPMRGAGVQHPHRRIVDQRHRFFRGVIGQTKNDQIDRVQQAAALALILALFRRDADELDIVAAVQPRPYLQAGGPSFAVDENPGLAHLPRFLSPMRRTKRC